MTRHLRLAILTLLVATLPAVAAPNATAGKTSSADQDTAMATAAAPKAVVDKPVVDQGTAPVGEAINTDFIIRNEGDAPLQILRVSPACGCTVAQYDKEIPPGGQGSVHTKIDTSNMAGPIAKSVAVFTNDPDTPSLQLTVKAEVRPFLIIQPGYARFTSAVHGDRDHDSNQLIWADDVDNLEVLGVKTPKPWIHAAFHKATAGEKSDKGSGTQWIVDVSIDKDAPVGPVADYVVVKTNHPKQPEAQIAVSGFVRPMIAVTPPDVQFGDVDPSKGQSWGILVRNFGSTPLEMTNQQSSVPGLDVSVEAIKAGQQFKVVLTPTDAMAKGSFDGKVEIQTNLPQQKTITIDVSGNVVTAKAEG